MAYINYPLSTPEGSPIPIDILEPIAALDPIDISVSPMVSAIVIPNFATRFIEIWATTDCTIGFNSTPVNGTTEKGIYHLRADDPRLLLPAAGYISALAWGDSGKLVVNLLARWEAIKKDYQTDIGE